MGTVEYADSSSEQDADSSLGPQLFGNDLFNGDSGSRLVVLLRSSDDPTLASVSVATGNIVEADASEGIRLSIMISLGLLSVFTILLV